MQLRSISTRLVVAIAGAGISAAVLLGGFSIQEQRSFNDQALTQDLQAQYASVLAAFEYEGRVTQTIATTIGGQPGVVAAMAAEDRDQLMRLIGPELEALTAQGITSLNLSKPPATLILRVQDPQAFGDDISARRKTVAQAQREHIGFAGVEAGRVGLYVFGMVPVALDGRHVGVVDVGVPLGQPFLERAKARFGAELAIHQFDGKQFTTVAATFADRTTASPDELKLAWDGAVVQRRGLLNGRPVASYLGQIKNFSGEVVAVIEIVKDTSAAEAMAAAAIRHMLLGTRNVQQAAIGTEEVSTNVAGLGEAVGKTGTAASAMLGAAGQLAEQADRLDREVDRFLATVRAA